MWRSLFSENSRGMNADANAIWDQLIGTSHDGVRRLLVILANLAGVAM
jgi:hypothetical protein